MTEGDTKYADVSDRLFAGVVDFTLLYFIITPLTYFLFPTFFGEIDPITAAMNEIMLSNPEITSEEAYEILFSEYDSAIFEGVKIFFYESIITFLMLGVYFVPLTAKKGQTLGKYVIGVRVIDKTNKRNISISQSFIRFFSYPVSILPIFIGYIFGGFRKDRRCWHDFISDTIVIFDENRWYKLVFNKIIGR